MLKLAVASLLAIGLSSTIADARRMPVPEPALVFEVDHHNKIASDLPESHFELRVDGTWRYQETVGKAIRARARGTLSRAKLHRIRVLLARAPWQVTTHEMACMAFAGSNTQFAVDGRNVWTEELCSGTSLDRRSTRRLAQVMAIVTPLLPR